MGRVRHPTDRTITLGTSSSSSSSSLGSHTTASRLHLPMMGLRQDGVILGTRPSILMKGGTLPVMPHTLCSICLPGPLRYSQSVA